MKEPKRVLFISQEIYPYLDQETPIRKMNRILPQACQEKGIETRTFMPKFGEINERRNQLHEVIRLSGNNIVINDTDHPVLLKVASIQSARIQIYFIDNDDYFHRRRGITDADGKEYDDNDERSIFFCRGSLDTVQKLRWTPNLVVCSGWMSALAPLYLRKGYAGAPFFANAKIVVALDGHSFDTPFPDSFAEKLRIRGVEQADVENLIGKKVTYADLMKLAIDYADAITVLADDVMPELIDYAQSKGLPILPYQPENKAEHVEFFQQLISNEAAEEQK